MIPGISTGGGGVSGATGGSQETNAAVRFGNFLSGGGGGGFNPFADPADNLATQLLKPSTILIFGVLILGGLYLLKKK